MKFKLQLNIIFNHKYTVSIQYVNKKNTDTIGHYIKKYKTKLKQSIFVSRF